MFSNLTLEKQESRPCGYDTYDTGNVSIDAHGLSSVKQYFFVNQRTLFILFTVYLYVNLWLFYEI